MSFQLYSCELWQTVSYICFFLSSLEGLMSLEYWIHWAQPRLWSWVLVNTSHILAIHPTLKFLVLEISKSPHLNIAFWYLKFRNCIFFPEIQFPEYKFYTLETQVFRMYTKNWVFINAPQLSPLSRI